ncbi:hypothetical protein P278_25820 [Zhouia amylolytica AD3]|uniref:Uncharacterized protein n=1 Tax=Zhouia amylolytica AD3 TaxID=1286632 RepID=W2UKW8_9FLAO|nr:hypothetical protein P278_25820 [Zhouia amylolytica AD3]
MTVSNSDPNNQDLSLMDYEVKKNLPSTTMKNKRLEQLHFLYPLTSSYQEV